MLLRRRLHRSILVTWVSFDNNSKFLQLLLYSGHHALSCKFDTCLTMCLSIACVLCVRSSSGCRCWEVWDCWRQTTGAVGSPCTCRNSSTQCVIIGSCASCWQLPVTACISESTLVSVVQIFNSSRTTCMFSESLFRKIRKRRTWGVSIGPHCLRHDVQIYAPTAVDGADAGGG